MRRETYERAGQEARASGVARKDNPFVVDAPVAYPTASDDETRRVLAEHWWRGWDGSAGARTTRKKSLA